MRIKQSALTNYRPDKTMVKTVNTVHAIVQVYSKPEYCVNVIADNGYKTEKHCYPLTKEQYDVYMCNDTQAQMKMIAKGGKIYGRA